MVESLKVGRGVNRSAARSLVGCRRVRGSVLTRCVCHRKIDSNLGLGSRRSESGPVSAPYGPLAPKQGSPASHPIAPPQTAPSTTHFVVT